jgi:hypothetical protein
MAKLDVKFVDKHLFFNFLLEQECLTYDKHSSGESQKVSFLKVPNVEIVEALLKDMRPCYVKLNHLREKDVENCALSFKEVFSAQSKKLFEQELENLKSILEECCVPLKNSQTIINHEVLKEFLFYPLFITATLSRVKCPLLFVKEKTFCCMKGTLD